MMENLEAKRIAEPREPDLDRSFSRAVARGRCGKLLPIMLEVMRACTRARPELRFEIAAASDSLARNHSREVARRGDSLGEADGDGRGGRADDATERSRPGRFRHRDARRRPFSGCLSCSSTRWRPDLSCRRMLIQVNISACLTSSPKREIVPEFIQGARATGATRGGARAGSSMIRRGARR